MQIEKTKDYELFETILGNRVLNQKKIQTICRDIEDGLNMLPYHPIIVSKNKSNGLFSVIDGQHRFEVSKKLDQEVCYVVCDSLSLKQIAQLNSRGQKWTINDFLNCYSKLGIEDYVVLRDLSREHRIQISTIGSFLMDNKPKCNFKEEFESGNFKINYLKETKELVDLTDNLFSQYRFSKDRYLLGAVQRIKENGLCDFVKLKSKIEQAPMMMDKQGDVKNYVYNIERVYNFKNQKREPLI